MDRNRPNVVNRLMSMAGAPANEGRGAQQSSSYTRQTQHSADRYRGNYASTSATDSSRMDYQSYPRESSYQESYQAVQSDNYNSQSTNLQGSTARYTPNERQQTKAANYPKRDQSSFGTWQNSAGRQKNVQSRSQSFYDDNYMYEDQSQEQNSRAGDVSRPQYEKTQIYERRSVTGTNEYGTGYGYPTEVKQEPLAASTKVQTPLIPDRHSERWSQQEYRDRPSTGGQQQQYENGPTVAATPRPEANTSQALETLLKGGVLQGIEGLVVNTTTRLLETILSSGVLQGVQANVSQQVADKLTAEVLQGLGRPAQVNVPHAVLPAVPMQGIQQLAGPLGSLLQQAATNPSQGSLRLDTARELVNNLQSAGILTGLEGPDGYASRQVIENLLTGGQPAGYPMRRGGMQQTFRGGGARPLFGAARQLRAPAPRGQQGQQFRQQPMRGRGREQFRQPVKPKKKEPAGRRNNDPKPPGKRPAGNAAAAPAAKKPKTEPKLNTPVVASSEKPGVASPEKKELKVWTWAKILSLSPNEQSAADEDDGDAGPNSTPRLRLPGVIKNADGMCRGDHGGVVSFQLPNGEELQGAYKDERAIANGFSLKTMRLYSGNPSLVFPFKEGRKVNVVYMLAPMIKRNTVSYQVDIEFRGEDSPGSPIELEDLGDKAIPNLDGTEVEGTVTAHYRQLGIVSFVADGEATPRLAHFSVAEAVVGGELIPHVTSGYVLYDGMKVRLKITSSADRRIPGIYHAADARVDVPMTPAKGEGDAAPIADTVYRGVILKMVDNRPRVLFCVCQTKTKDKFYVICEEATVGDKPTADSHLHFGEGTRVICALKFRHDYGEVAPSGVYIANANMPLRKAVVKQLRQMRGVSYPGVLTTTFDDNEVIVIVARNNFRINGKSSNSSFPKDFFKPGMVMEINHCTNSREFTVSLDISTNILKMKEALEESIIPINVVDIQLVKKNNRRKKSRVADTAKGVVTKGLESTNGSGPAESADLKCKGVVTAVQANPSGNQIYTTARATVGGVATDVHIEQVFVNGKPGLHLPQKFVKVGDQVTLQRVKKEPGSQRHSATVQLYFPKESIRSVLEAQTGWKSK